MTRRIFRLYAGPSFFEGMARLLDIGGTLNEYNLSDSPGQADARAIESDWEAVGLDIIVAAEKFHREYQEADGE